jgi:hypothetical protein
MNELTGVTPKQPQHMAVNDSIELLTVVRAQLENLIGRINGEGVEEVEVRPEATRIPSLHEILTEAPDRITVLKNDLESLIYRVEELLF